MDSEIPQFHPIDGYDIGEYRYAVAAAVKYLIRLRTKAEGRRFQSSRQYNEWHLGNIDQDPDSIVELHRKLKLAIDKIWREFLGPHGSGGIPFDESYPLREFISLVSDFIREVEESGILNRVESFKFVEWDRCVRWNRLVELRRWLKRLPHPARGAPDCPLHIGNPKLKEVRVFGLPLEYKLTKPGFDVLRTLHEAFPGRLSKEQLTTRSDHSDAVGILNRLVRNSGQLKQVVLPSGIGREGYGLAPLSQIDTRT